MYDLRQDENSENEGAEVSEEQEEWLKSSFRCDIAAFRCSSNDFSSKSMTNDAEEISKSGGSEMGSSTSKEVKSSFDAKDDET